MFIQIHDYVDITFFPRNMAVSKKHSILLVYRIRKMTPDKNKRRSEKWWSFFSCMHVYSKMNKRKYFAMMDGGKGRKKPSVWTYPRDENWFPDIWQNRVIDDYQGNRWKEDFRMKGSTFANLVAVLTPYLQKRGTRFRLAIPVEKRVAIGVWRLATGNSFRTLSTIFAAGKATAVHIVHEFCSALTRLSETYIKFPRTPIELGMAIPLFKDDVNCKIPQAFASVDGTHIEIMAPDCPSKTDYFARTKRYTVNTQCIVGANLIFYSVVTGYPGSCHDQGGQHS